MKKREMDSLAWNGFFSQEPHFNICLIIIIIIIQFVFCVSVAK